MTLPLTNRKRFDRQVLSMAPVFDPLSRTACQLNSGLLLCRRANKEGKGFRDIAYSQSAV